MTLFCFASIGFSQNIDKRLLPRYSESELVSMQKNNPDEYSILVRALDVAVSIGEYFEQDGKTIQFDGELDADPSTPQTFISLGVDLLDNRNQYFKFKGTNKIAIVYSKNTIMQIK